MLLDTVWHIPVTRYALATQAGRTYDVSLSGGRFTRRGDAQSHAISVQAGVPQKSLELDPLVAIVGVLSIPILQLLD